MSYAITQGPSGKAALWKDSALVAEYLRQVRQGIPLAEVQLDVMMRMIEGRGTPVQNFIDLGCGGGILAAAILSEYPNARGVLVDFSEPMISAAIQNLQRHSRRLQFASLDYSHPEWLNIIHRRGPFDVIVSGFSISEQPDEAKQQVYRDIFDLLEPGGIFVNMDYVSLATPWLRKIHDDFYIDTLWSQQEGVRVRRSRATIAKSYHERPEREVTLPASVEVQCDWLGQIGFEDVDCYFRAFAFAVFGGKRGDDNS
jgi:ubiquinone/menaquinone biosynthesis C-methylase UbiE